MGACKILFRATGTFRSESFPKLHKTQLGLFNLQKNYRRERKTEKASLNNVNDAGHLYSQATQVAKPCANISIY